MMIYDPLLSPSVGTTSHSCGTVRPPVAAAAGNCLHDLSPPLGLRTGRRTYVYLGRSSWYLSDLDFWFRWSGGSGAARREGGRYSVFIIGFGSTGVCIGPAVVVVVARLSDVRICCELLIHTGGYSKGYIWLGGKKRKIKIGVGESSVPRFGTRPRPGYTLRLSSPQFFFFFFFSLGFFFFSFSSDS